MKILSIITALVAGTLAACGGGGGGGSSTEYPVEATFASAFTTSSSYTTTARDNSGNVFVLDFAITPGPTKTEPLISADPKSTALISVAVSVNNSYPVTDVTELYFTRTPFSVAGSLNGTTVYRVTQATALPATARIGASGVFATGTITDGSVTTTQTMTWLLESDPGTANAWLCMVMQVDAPDGRYMEKDCFRIDAAGNVSGFKTDISTPGLTLQFR